MFQDMDQHIWICYMHDSEDSHCWLHIQVDSWVVSQCTDPHMNKQPVHSQTDICYLVHMEMAGMGSQLLVELELKNKLIVTKWENIYCTLHIDYWQGYTNPMCQVITATIFCTVVPNIFGIELSSGHPSGVWNFGMTFYTFEKFVDPWSFVLC